MLKKLTVAERIVVAAIACILGYVFLPFLAQDRHPQRSRCNSHLKQLGISLIIYLSDNDERFPTTTWHDEIMPYAKNVNLFSCDAVKKWGYAFNRDLLGRDASKVPDHANFPMLFETDALAKDVVANLAARVKVRHGRGSYICRVDSGVRLVRESP